jgi:hypothetical protein
MLGLHGPHAQGVIGAALGVCACAGGGAPVTLGN